MGDGSVFNIGEREVGILLKHLASLYQDWLIIGPDTHDHVVVQSTFFLSC